VTTAIEIAREPVTLPISSSALSFYDLLGVDGQRHSLYDLDDRSIVVLVFSSNRCPTAKAYTARMNALAERYAQAGVALIAINSNDPHLYPDESYERMIETAAEQGYQFAYLFDEGQQVARAYGPTRTFEVFALDRDRRLRYHGRFDDARLEGRVTTPDLANAIDDLLAGRPVRVAETRPFGCSLDLM